MRKIITPAALPPDVLYLLSDELWRTKQADPEPTFFIFSGLCRALRYRGVQHLFRNVDFLVRYYNNGHVSTRIMSLIKLGEKNPYVFSSIRRLTLRGDLARLDPIHCLSGLDNQLLSKDSLLLMLLPKIPRLEALLIRDSSSGLDWRGRVDVGLQDMIRDISKPAHLDLWNVGNFPFASFATPSLTALSILYENQRKPFFEIDGPNFQELIAMSDSIIPHFPNLDSLSFYVFVPYGSHSLDVLPSISTAISATKVHNLTALQVTLDYSKTYESLSTWRQQFTPPGWVRFDKAVSTMLAARRKPLEYVFRMHLVVRMGVERHQDASNIQPDTPLTPEEAADTLRVVVLEILMPLTYNLSLDEMSGVDFGVHIALWINPF